MYLNGLVFMKSLNKSFNCATLHHLKFCLFVLFSLYKTITVAHGVSAMCIFLA